MRLTHLLPEDSCAQRGYEPIQRAKQLLLPCPAGSHPRGCFSPTSPREASLWTLSLTGRTREGHSSSLTHLGRAFVNSSQGFSSGPCGPWDPGLFPKAFVCLSLWIAGLIFVRKEPQPHDAKINSGSEQDSLSLSPANVGVSHGGEGYLAASHRVSRWTQVVAVHMADCMAAKGSALLVASSKPTHPSPESGQPHGGHMMVTLTVSVSWAAVTRYHKLGGYKNRNFLPQFWRLRV